MIQENCGQSPITTLDLGEKEILNLQHAGFDTLRDLVVFFEHHLGCQKVPEDYTLFEYYDILQNLKRLGCWPDHKVFAGIVVQDLKMSKVCELALKRNRLDTVDEVILALEIAYTGGLKGIVFTVARWVKHVDEIVEALREIGYWPQCPESEELAD